MCLIDFGVKGLGLLGIENSQGCSMFIQRDFAAICDCAFCIFDAPFVLTLIGVFCTLYGVLGNCAVFSVFSAILFTAFT